VSNLALLGGNKIRERAFPNRVSMGTEEKEAAIRVLDSDVLSGFVGAAGKFFNGGAEVRNFENLWADKYGFNHAISCNSWTAGLQIMMGAIGIEHGDEVIVPAYTMSATATAALFYGGIPIFADIDPHRYTISPESIEALITERTKAIVVVHLFGLPADMDPILDIAKRHGIYVLEDAAQAPGVRYKGRPVGTIGDIGGFSLNFHKHIHCGEGGLIVTDNEELADRCRLIRNHGENAAENYSVSSFSNLIGGNYRFSELHAAIASEQLKKLPDILEHRSKIGNALSSKLACYNELSLPIEEAETTNAFYMYPMTLNISQMYISRNTFVKAVTAELPKANYWDTTPLAEGYVEPLYKNWVYQKRIALGSKGFPFNWHQDVTYDYSGNLCPITQKKYDTELVLTPLVREGITEEDITDFANAIDKVLSNQRDLIEFDLNHADGSTEIYDAVKAIDENVD
jgi:dTDP-4-amino-4,6-dideoxygalactose transaminase